MVASVLHLIQGSTSGSRSFCMKSMLPFLNSRTRTIASGTTLKTSPASEGFPSHLEGFAFKVIVPPDWTDSNTKGPEPGGGMVLGAASPVELLGTMPMVKCSRKGAWGAAKRKRKRYGPS